MKIIYLAAYKAYHPKWDVTYQDINGKRDIGGDMMDVNLDPYDVIIATPPCNYWSIANYRRETSNYSQMTKYLLPGTILRLKYLGKPFIIENVRNYKLMNEYGLMNCGLFIYEVGRHTYWTNIPFNPSNIKQNNDEFDYRPLLSGKRKGKMGMWSSSKNRQGGDNVHRVIEYWLEVVHAQTN